MSWLEFTDQYGLVTLEPGQTSQNGALFTAELSFLLTPGVVRHTLARNAIDALMQGGLTYRYPGDKEYDSMDNVIALATMDALSSYKATSTYMVYFRGSITRATGVDQGQSKESNNKYYWLARLMNLGRRPRFFWNNNNPDLFCFPGWHGRSPGFLSYLKMCAGLPTGPLDAFVVMVGQFLGCFAKKEDTNARKLPYVAWQYLKTRGWVWKLAYKLWCKILVAQYGPTGMKAVYGVYFRNPNHPITQMSPPYLP